MRDFETLPHGSIKELELSRNLIRVMQQTVKSYGKGIFPRDVITCYDALIEHHANHLERESYD
jgi:hypothetical protein